MAKLIHKKAKKSKSPNKNDPWRGSNKHILKSNTVVICGVGIIFFLAIAALGHAFPQYISPDITGKSEFTVLTLIAIIITRLAKGDVSFTK